MKNKRDDEEDYDMEYSARPKRTNKAPVKYSKDSESDEEEGYQPKRKTTQRGKKKEDEDEDASPTPSPPTKKRGRPKKNTIPQGESLTSFSSQNEDFDSQKFLIFTPLCDRIPPIQVM